MQTTELTILDGYALSASELIAKFESISPADLYAPVAGFIPQNPCDIIDLGAGTGRDATWFAVQGHKVVAVEPVAALSDAGKALHQSSRIKWINDTLPDLPRVLERGDTFDFVLLNAVWHHLDIDQRKQAMSALRVLTRPGATLIMSLRNGPGSPMRSCIEARPEDAIELASSVGFKLEFMKSAKSIQSNNQAANVTWDWLVFSPEC